MILGGGERKRGGWVGGWRGGDGNLQNPDKSEDMTMDSRRYNSRPSEKKRLNGECLCVGGEELSGEGAW